MSGNGTISATTIPNLATRITPEVATRKIAIIGKAPSSVKLAPYDDESWEIWVLNTLGFNKEVPRWDRQFELHELEQTKAPEYGGYYEWLKEQTKPVLLRDAPPAEFRHGVQYPLGEIQQAFAGMPGAAYLTNTVSLMLALALYEARTQPTGQAVSDVGCWGVDMAQHGTRIGTGNALTFTSEYARQRPSCEYWIGVACGMGIQFHLPDECDLLKSSCVYGYHHTDRMKKWVVRRKELDQRISQAEQMAQKYRDESIFLAGAREGQCYHEQGEFFYEENVK